MTQALGVVAVGLLIGISVQSVRAWTAPTAAPPGGLVPAAPITTGSTPQIRSGSLTFGDGVSADTPNLIFAPAGGNSYSYFDNYLGNTRLLVQQGLGERETMRIGNDGWTAFVAQNGGYVQLSPSDGAIELGSGNDEFSYIDFHKNDNLSGDFDGRLIFGNTGFSLLGGNVGIGTTNPQAKLDVNGGVRTWGPTALALNSYGRNNGIMVGDAQYQIYSLGGNFTMQSAIGNVELQPGSGGKIMAYGPLYATSVAATGDVCAQNGTKCLSSLGSGSGTVGGGGSGLATMLPKWTNDTTLGNSIINDDGSGTATVGGVLQIMRDNADVQLRFHDPNDFWYSMGIDRSDSGKFKINSGGNIGDTNGITMDTSGNVGIGTTNPQAKLDVSGGLAVKGNVDIGPNASGAYLSVGGTPSISSNKASVAVSNGNLHLDSAWGHNTYINYLSDGNTILNYPNSSSSGAGGGNVSIGAADSSGYKLFVGGNSYATTSTASVFCLGGYCISSWPSAGGSGTVTGTGTPGIITKWNAAGTGLTNSLISDDGSSVATVNGWLNVNSSLQVSHHGGAAPNIIIGDGGGANTSRSDIKLVDSASNPKTLLLWGGDNTNSYQMGNFSVQASNSYFSNYVQVAGNVHANGVIGAGFYATLGTSVAGGFYQDANNGAYRAISASGDRGFYFQPYNGGSTTMFVGLSGAYAGNVGIGTEAPQMKLDVNGGIHSSGQISANGIIEAVSGIKFGDGTVQTTAAYATYR